jgi:hypothetical protein
MTNLLYNSFNKPPDKLPYSISPYFLFNSNACLFTVGSTSNPLRFQSLPQLSHKPTSHTSGGYRASHSSPRLIFCDRIGDPGKYNLSVSLSYFFSTCSIVSLRVTADAAAKGDLLAEAGWICLARHFLSDKLLRESWRAAQLVSQRKHSEDFYVGVKA